MASLMLVIFTLSIIFMLWRPKGINETIPITIGAVFIVMLGLVTVEDLVTILSIVSGPALRILSTLMMSIVLESIGFFKWIAQKIILKARNSGTRLFVYTNLLCFFMTMLFNNDGSILITTPIIIHIARLIKLKHHETIPYLISGALIATTSSAPIAVSNISNLIALKIVGLDLNSYVKMLFVPSMIGIFVMSICLFLYFRRSLPKYLKHPRPMYVKKEGHLNFYKVCIFVVVVTRGAFFVLTPLGVPMEVIGLIGACLLIFLRWMKWKKGIRDIIFYSPWHILLFAFSMYVLVYGLKNVGLNGGIVNVFEPIIHESLILATIVMGLLTTFFSNVFNNLPAVMISTMAISEMDLSPLFMKVAYLANVIGSDIGSLLTPVGTLATLIWMFLLKKHHIPISWRQYLKITVIIIPITLFISLISLYCWVLLLY